MFTRQPSKTPLCYLQVRIAKSRIPEDNIMNAGLRNAGYCFIEFKKLNSAVQAVCSMDGTRCEDLLCILP